jgi:hypothetical protein
MKIPDMVSTSKRSVTSSTARGRHGTRSRGGAARLPRSESCWSRPCLLERLDECFFFAGSPLAGAGHAVRHHAGVDPDPRRDRPLRDASEREALAVLVTSRPLLRPPVARLDRHCVPFVLRGARYAVPRTEEFTHPLCACQRHIGKFRGTFCAYMDVGRRGVAEVGQHREACPHLAGGAGLDTNGASGEVGDQSEDSQRHRGEGERQPLSLDDAGPA